MTNTVAHESKVLFDGFTPKQKHDIEELQLLADHMAGCATSMNSHMGYATFIEAREQFRSRLTEVSSCYARIDFS